MAKKQPKNRQKDNESDPLYALKYVAWCRSQMPPDDVESTMADLVNYAKHYLCVETKTLFKDAVWEDYTAEEILVEFFAHRFSSEEDFRDQFDAVLKGGTLEEHYEWFEKMEKEYQESRTQELEEFSDDYSK